MELESLYDLYLHELRDLSSAEQQLIKVLPRMSKAATNRGLAAGFSAPGTEQARRDLRTGGDAQGG